MSTCSRSQPPPPQTHQSSLEWFPILRNELFYPIKMLNFDKDSILDASPIFTASWMLTCWENHQQILWIKPKAIQGHLDDFKVLWFSSTYIFNIIQKNHWNSMLILMWNQLWIQLIHFAKVGRSQLTEGGILLLNVASVINKCCLNKTVASNISKCRLNWTAASNINKSRLNWTAASNINKSRLKY